LFRRLLMGIHASDTTKNVPSTTKKVLAAGGLALGLGFGLFAGTGTAAADGLDATPVPPAVIDDDSFQNYDTSSFPAAPLWPAPASYPADPSWPGDSSHSCCSR
jgi:hypothetical protein